jgi:uncharacterized integral membrane protein (TIGR00697 family)
VKLDARLNLFITLVAVFMVCLVVGDLIGGKVTSIHAFGREWPFSVGQLAFPVTFILTDILNEFYGRKVVRRITFLAFAMVGLTFIIVYAAGAMPWWSVTLAPSWNGVTPHEFDVVFTQATRIQLSSTVFFYIKKATGNRMLWLRATGSTAVSQLIDTAIITALVFGTRITFEQYVSFVMTSYLIKLAAAIGVTPIIYALHNIIERKFKIPPAKADNDNDNTDIVPDAVTRDDRD